MMFYMETNSVEDNRKRILFNVFVCNVQPGVTINYETGESHITNTKYVNRKKDTRKLVPFLNQNDILSSCSSKYDKSDNKFKES